MKAVGVRADSRACRTTERADGIRDTAESQSGADRSEHLRHRRTRRKPREVGDHAVNQSAEIELARRRERHECILGIAERTRQRLLGHLRCVLRGFLIDRHRPLHADAPVGLQREPLLEIAALARDLLRLGRVDALDLGDVLGRTQRAVLSRALRQFVPSTAKLVAHAIDGLIQLARVVTHRHRPEFALHVTLTLGRVVAELRVDLRTALLQPVDRVAIAHLLFQLRRLLVHPANRLLIAK
ncbi:hypothetical protein X947_6082 [Burkholderia pseudomallei MSHR7334]|nr:hypothetical protein X947_6082 [Burkholderia pseudomallei MSHR7334]